MSPSLFYDTDDTLQEAVNVALRIAKQYCVVQSSNVQCKEMLCCTKQHCVQCSTKLYCVVQSSTVNKLWYKVVLFRTVYYKAVLCSTKQH